MDIQIKESKINLYLRYFLKGICIFILSIGIIFLILQLFMKNIIVLILGLIFIFFGFYFFRSIVKIKNIKNNSISVIFGKKEIDLNYSEINYFFKSVPYSITNRYGILISLRKKGINKYLIIFNEPQVDLLTIMKNSGIKVKNIG